MGRGWWGATVLDTAGCQARAKAPEGVAQHQLIRSLEVVPGCGRSHLMGPKWPQGPTHFKESREGSGSEIRGRHLVAVICGDGLMPFLGGLSMRLHTHKDVPGASLPGV